jgi:hypothetical protein
MRLVVLETSDFGVLGVGLRQATAASRLNGLGRCILNPVQDRPACDVDSGNKQC